MEDSKKSGYDPSLYTDEAKQSRFKKVAEKRTNRILNDFRLLGNTSNKSLYKYEAADVEKIFDVIEQRMTEIRSRFKSRKQDKPFSLD